MRRILIFLKLDLKILDKVIFIFFIVLFSSCQTLKVNKVSNIIETPISVENSEVDLPYIQDYKPLDLDVSPVMTLPPNDLKKDSPFFPLLAFEDLKTPWFSLETNEITNSEYSLPILLPLEKTDENIIIPPIVTKQVAVKPVVTEKPVVIGKPVVINPIVVHKPIVIESKETESTDSNVFILNDMNVFYGKSFTIEMDQSGWLYEGEIKNLQFKNKFYTNNKVLFEFFAMMPGDYDIEFSKYTDSGTSYSRVNVHVVDDIFSEDVTEDGEPLTIVPEDIKKSISEKSRLESQLKNIDSVNNPDEIYFKLGQIYFDEGLLKKSKEYFEFVYDNYPLSIYYEEAKDKMDYIINNFLKRR